MNFLSGYAAFLDYRYWLNTNPVPLGPTLAGGVFAFFAWFLITSLVLAIIAHAVAKKDALKAGILQRFSASMGTTGTLGLLLLLFAYELVPIFDMRLWLLVLFIIFAIWIMRIAWHVVREYPVERARIAERARLEKYLPHHKK